MYIAPRTKVFKEAFLETRFIWRFQLSKKRFIWRLQKFCEQLKLKHAVLAKIQILGVSIIVLVCDFISRSGRMCWPSWFPLITSDYSLPPKLTRIKLFKPKATLLNQSTQFKPNVLGCVVVLLVFALYSNTSS